MDDLTYFLMDLGSILKFFGLEAQRLQGLEPWSLGGLEAWMISHIFDAFGVRFEAFWRGILVLLDAFGGYFGTSGASWNASWFLGAPRSLPGPIKDPPGSLLDAHGADLGPNLSQLGANLGPTWAQLEPTWRQLGPKWGCLSKPA